MLLSNEKIVPVAGTVQPQNLVKWMLSHGASAITGEQIAALLGVQRNLVSHTLTTLRKKNEIITPVSGLWIPVAPEYLAAGGPPAIEMIDDIMSYLGITYYVGWLSAAAYYGAAHHAAQVFQVATNRTMRSKNTGRTTLQFYTRQNIECRSTRKREVKTGYATLSSLETTLLDVTRDLSIVGGLDNAANLVIEMCESNDIDFGLLIQAAENYPITAASRLGWLMDNFAEDEDTDALAEYVAHKTSVYAWLDSSAPTALTKYHNDKKWHLIINREVEPDV
jgi:predicted transcriptional regulator of viral defense system